MCSWIGVGAVEHMAVGNCWGLTGLAGGEREVEGKFKKASPSEVLMQFIETVKQKSFEHVKTMQGKENWEGESQAAAFAFVENASSETCMSIEIIIPNHECNDSYPDTLWFK